MTKATWERSSFWLTAEHDGEGMVAGAWGGCSHLQPGSRKRWAECWCSANSPLFIQPGTQLMEWCYLKLGWVLLPLLTQPRLSHGSVQRFVFWVITDPVKLTILAIRKAINGYAPLSLILGYAFHIELWSSCEANKNRFWNPKAWLLSLLNHP